MQSEQSLYGFCPKCGARGKSRERRPNGNDTCENGHTYAISRALTNPISEAEIEQLDMAGFKRGYLSAINHPELNDFARAIVLEAQHQRDRWGPLHDRNKKADDWLWVVANLTTKAAQAARYGDMDKYKHHIITACAVLANWHRIVVDGDGTVIPEGGWQAVTDAVSEWAEKAFPDATLHTRMEIVRRETVELENSNGKDLMEYPDLLLPILHSAKAAGFDLNDLLRACWDKLDVVKKRQWGPPDEHGVHHHVKAGAVAAISLAAMIAAASPAEAANNLLPVTCLPRPVIAGVLKGALHEQQTGLGYVPHANAVWELWTSKDGKGWTLMFTLQDGTSCVAAKGDDWEQWPPVEAVDPS
jgi:hypothetical protein